MDLIVIKCIDCKSSLDYMITRDDQLIFRCFECKQNYQKDFNKDLVILFLRKGIYPYEYIDSWEGFGETLPDKEAFFSSLNMEGITSVDYRYAKRVYKEFKSKSLGDYHDLYV